MARMIVRNLFIIITAVICFFSVVSADTASRLRMPSLFLLVILTAAIGTAIAYLFRPKAP